jgi:hypothetical protein
MIKVVMGVIMIIVLFSRALMVPVYLAQLGLIGELGATTVKALRTTSFVIMVFALAFGAFIILRAMWRGKQAEATFVAMAFAEGGEPGTARQILAEASREASGPSAPAKEVASATTLGAPAARVRRSGT